MAKKIKVITSCTELPQYARLVGFLAEITELAAERQDDDPELMDLLASVSDDLLEIASR